MEAPALFIATPGGHVQELVEWESRLPGLPKRRVWVTSRNPQTESLLLGREVRWVPPVRSRELRRALGSVPGARSLVRALRPAVVVSTGAAMSLPYLIAARLDGVPVHYLESATRRDAPSLTGRILASVPGVRCWSATPFSPAWHHAPSLLDSFTLAEEVATPIQRVVVTMGSERHRFDGAVDAALRCLPTAAEVLWQLGSTAPHSRVPSARAFVPADQLERAIRDADLVITHAGVGSVLTTLSAGRVPVVLPRSSSRGEHVDDHQNELAGLLHNRGLAIVREPEALTSEDLSRAARQRVLRAVSPPPLSVDQPAIRAGAKRTPWSRRDEVGRNDGI